MRPDRETLPGVRLAWLIDWLYPPRCRSCSSRIFGADAQCFCEPCWRRIRRIGSPKCSTCGRPFLDASGDDHECASCLSHTPPFRRARAWACYPREDAQPAPLREVVHRFKYGRKISLGKPLGRLMALGCADDIVACRPDVVVPVPLHPKRLKWRGFNQSLVLARQVGRYHAIPVDPFTLFRTVETAPQTQLSEQDRRKNVRGAFALSERAKFRDRKVLLVDDVYTSGATASECSRVLMRGGAREVHVLTLARTI